MAYATPSTRSCERKGPRSIQTGNLKPLSFGATMAVSGSRSKRPGSRAFRCAEWLARLYVQGRSGGAVDTPTLVPLANTVLCQINALAAVQLVCPQVCTDCNDQLSIQR